MSDVFISYAHEDRPMAETLADVLTRQGHSVFWDRRIVPGTTWDEALERELAQARCVVVLWSRHSVISKWVKTEAGEAAERSVLMPVLIEETELPLRFKSLQTANLVDWDKDEDHPELQSVLQAIKRLTDLNPSAETLQTPSRTSAGRSWKRRRRWIVGLLVALTITGLTLFETYKIAIRKGWFATNLQYYTLLHSGEGLAVGDTVTIKGTPAGEIVRIELMPPGDEYDVYVSFTIRKPFYDLVWTSSRAVVEWNPSRLKRSLDIPGATSGGPCFLFREMSELPIKDAIPLLQGQKAASAQDVYGGKGGTNLIVRALQTISTQQAENLANSGLERLKVLFPNTSSKRPTAIWDDRLASYVAIDQKHREYWLPSDEGSKPGP